MVKSLIVNIIPNFLVRAFARPYVSGDSILKAISKADELWKEGLSCTLDLLGEEVTSKAMVENNIKIYVELINLSNSRSHFASVSLKPTSLGIQDGFEYCLKSLETIIKVAKRNEVEITIDMEDHQYTDLTLKLYSELHSKYPTLGTVLQSRLYRTEKDIHNLPRGRSRIRNCIGIYDESGDIAYQNKPQMKKKLIDYTQQLIENGHYVEVATHDKNVISEALELAKKNSWTSDQIEFQQLLGVPMKNTQNEILSSGFVCRVYIPFAIDWKFATPYLKRRLINNPKIIYYVFAQLFARIFRR